MSQREPSGVGRTVCFLDTVRFVAQESAVNLAGDVYGLRHPKASNDLENTAMKRCMSNVAALSTLLLVAACAETPMGPTVQVLPGPGKSFSSFQNDQAICRQFAEQAV